MSSAMGVRRVTAALLALLVCGGLAGSPASMTEPARLGLNLAQLSLALVESVSLPEAHREFDLLPLQLYTSHRLLEGLGRGRSLLVEWLDATPEDRPWREQLTGLLDAAVQAEATLEPLPAGRLSAIPEDQLTTIMDALDAVRGELEALEAVIEDHLPSDKERWGFQMGFLCGSLVGSPTFPPPLPEEDAHFLAHEIPSDLPPEAHEAVYGLLQLLPEHRHRQVPEWRSVEQREAATELARIILAELGVGVEADPAEGES